jgi:replicative DNA helicase
MDEIKQIVYTPAEIGALSKLSIRERLKAKKNGYGLPFPIDYVAKDLNQLAPGDLLTVTGRPGNGKTHLMKWWARKRAEQLAEMEEHNRVVVYVTYEQHIEDLNNFDLADMTGINLTSIARCEITDADIELLDAANVRRHALPLWSIGHSANRRGRRPKMTVDVLADALHGVQTWTGDENGYLIDSVFIDYLQRMPYNGRESKAVGISDNLDEIKDLAFAIVAPIVVGVQAKREVDKYDVQVPGPDDGQWTSNIEQTSDVNIAVARPSKYRHDGETFGSVVVEGFQQMVMVIWKQKLGIDNERHWIMCDPRYNRVSGAQERVTSL